MSVRPNENVKQEKKLGSPETLYTADTSEIETPKKEVDFKSDKDSLYTIKLHEGFKRVYESNQYVDSIIKKLYDNTMIYQNMNLVMLDYVSPTIIFLEEQINGILFKKLGINSEWLAIDHITVEISHEKFFRLPVFVPGKYLLGEIMKIKGFINENIHLIANMIIDKFEFDTAGKHFHNFKELIHSTLNLRKENKSFIETFRKAKDMVNAQLDAFMIHVSPHEVSHHMNQTFNFIKGKIIQETDYDIDTLKIYGIEMKDKIMVLSWNVVAKSSEIIRSALSLNKDRYTDTEKVILQPIMEKSTQVFTSLLHMTDGLVEKTEDTFNFNLTWIRNSIQIIYDKLKNTE